MLNNTQHIAEISQANLEKSVRLANIALSGAERLFNLQMTLARDILAENAETAKSLSEVKSVQDLLELQKTLSQPSVEKTLNVARSVYSAATATQTEINKLVEEQVLEFNKSLLTNLDKAIESMPAAAGATSLIKSAMESAAQAYGTVTQTSQRIVHDLGDVAVAAVESATKTASRRSSK